MKAKQLIAAGAVAATLLAAGAAVVIQNSTDQSAQRAAGDVPKEQRFSIMCTPVHESREDPFLNPIGTDQDHTHVFFGSAGIRTWPNSPVDKEVGMRNAGTSCEFSGDTAAYWVPLFQDRNGKIIRPTQALVYYRHKGSGPVVPHPEGLNLKSFDIEWGCLDSDQFTAPPNCSDREIRMRVIFPPSIVNGVPTPRIAMNVRYDTRQGQGGHILGGASGEHGNFFNTWNQDAYRDIINTCLVKSSVDRMTTAQWNDICPRHSDGNKPPPPPTKTPSPSPSPSPSPPLSPSPSPSPTVNPPPQYDLTDVKACMAVETRLGKLQCVRKILRAVGL